MNSNTMTKNELISYLQSHRSSTYAAKAGEYGCVILPGGEYTVSDTTTGNPKLTGKFNEQQIFGLASTALYLMANKDADTLKEYFAVGRINAGNGRETMQTLDNSLTNDDLLTVITDTLKVELTPEQIIELGFVDKLPKAVQAKIEKLKQEKQDSLIIKLYAQSLGFIDSEVIETSTGYQIHGHVSARGNVCGELMTKIITTEGMEFVGSQSTDNNPIITMSVTVTLIEQFKTAEKESDADNN